MEEVELRVSAQIIEERSFVVRVAEDGLAHLLRVREPIAYAIEIYGVKLD